MVENNSNDDSTEAYNLVKRSRFFDAKWYKRTYGVKGDAVKHYLEIGAKVGYNPSSKFSRIKYELIYDDVRYVGVNPIVHYEKYGCYESLFTEEVYIGDAEREVLKQVKKTQDEQIAKEYDSSIEKLIVFLVPEEDVISGGVMSINSIAKVSKDLKEIHHSEVIICTMPNPRTFLKYSKFKADFNIYRFDQLLNYFKRLNNLIIHIPEIYVRPFLAFLSPNQQNWLKNIQYVQINVLNQNIEFMPRPRYVNYLKELSNKVTMTCAHKKYCVSQMRTSYDIDVHLFSTSNFTKYQYRKYVEKDDLLVYSPDFHPMKEHILTKLRNDFPDLELLEIRNMSYREYLDTIARAKWAITFGEGLDGYFSESIRSGAMAFSVRNMNFFDDSYDSVPNVFDDYSQMQEKISEFMREYSDSCKFDRLVRKCIEIDAKLYNDVEYVENIRQYYIGNYTFPRDDVLKGREVRMAGRPLVSVAMATFNGGKYIDEQIRSILAQDYQNIEIIVSDDGSTDGTRDILNSYEGRIKVIRNVGRHGLLGNFSNAINHCNGEFIALSDQDDVWERNKISRLLEMIDNFDIVQSGVCVIDENGEYHPKKYMHEAYEIDKTMKYRIQDNIIESTMLGCTTLMRSDFVKKFAVIPDEIIYHDMWLLYNAILRGNGVVYIDEQLVRYRQHGKNTAYLTYNSGTWERQKIIADRYMLEFFEGIDPRLKKLFRLDISFNLIKGILKRCLPDGLDEYLMRNYGNLDIKNFVSLLEQFRKDIQECDILGIKDNIE